MHHSLDCILYFVTLGVRDTGFAIPSLITCTGLDKMCWRVRISSCCRERRVRNGISGLESSVPRKDVSKHFKTHVFDNLEIVAIGLSPGQYVCNCKQQAQLR